MRAPAALRTWRRRCVRWRRSSADVFAPDAGWDSSSNLNFRLDRRAPDMTDTQAVHAPPVAENRTLRRSLYPHRGDAGRHQPEWRHLRRLVAQPDGYRGRRVRLQDREAAHGHGGDRRDEIFANPCSSAISYPCTPASSRLARPRSPSIRAWVMRRKEMHSILVTDGNFTYVAIDDQGVRRSSRRARRRSRRRGRH